MVVGDPEDAFPYVRWLGGGAATSVCRRTIDIRERVPANPAVVIVDQSPIDQLGPDILQRIRDQCQNGRIITFTRSNTTAPRTMDKQSDAWVRRPIHRTRFTKLVEQYRRIVEYETLVDKNFERLQAQLDHESSSTEGESDEEDSIHHRIRRLESAFDRSDYVTAFRAIGTSQRGSVKPFGRAKQNER